MDSLKRAKNFIAARAGKLALAIVPLAAATMTVMPAHARSVQVEYNGGCEVTAENGSLNFGSGGFCGVAVNSAPGANTGANSFGIYGNNRVYGSGASGSSFGLTYLTSMIDINSVPAAPADVLNSVPVAWDFTLTGSDPNAEIRYTLTFQMDQTSYNPFGDYAVAQSGQRVVGSGIFTGFDFLGGPLTVTFNATTFNNIGGQQYLDVEVPGGKTIDFNVAFAQAPEPASLFLVAPALGLLFIRRKKQ